MIKFAGVATNRRGIDMESRKFTCNFDQTVVIRRQDWEPGGRLEDFIKQFLQAKHTLTRKRFCNRLLLLRQQAFASLIDDPSF